MYFILIRTKHKVTITQNCRVTFSIRTRGEKNVDVRLLLAECLAQKFHFLSLPGNVRETKTALFGMTVYTWSPPLLSQTLTTPPTLLTIPYITSMVESSKQTARRRINLSNTPSFSFILFCTCIENFLFLYIYVNQYMDMYL